MIRLLLMDIGGTSVKYSRTATPETPGKLAVSRRFYNSDGSAGEILVALTGAAEGESEAVVCTPGPFDHINGVSLMRHKFGALYGVSLKEAFAAKGVSARFLHDSVAFMLGAAALGETKDARRPVCITLGTGVGAAIMLDGRVPVTPLGTTAFSVYSRPFRGGTIEGSFGRSAIRRSYAELSGCGEAPDVDEIARRAKEGESCAAVLMRELGVSLAQALSPILERVGCDRLILGGGVSGASELFLGGLRERLSVPVTVSAHTSDAALYGCCRYYVSGDGALETTESSII